MSNRGVDAVSRLQLSLAVVSMDRPFAGGVAAAWVLFLLLAPAASCRGQEATAEELWQALGSGGHLVLMRHALAPGGGDPSGFRLDDCTTQRNLSDEGRRQARSIGAALRSAGVRFERVLTSQWCRCRETAELLGLAVVEDYPVLNSFFADGSTAREQTDALRRFVGGQRPRWNIMLVTHQVNITELTGVFPMSGEMVVLRPDGKGGVAVLGRLRPEG